jgi:Mg2+ and Co2+ transporter CorA
MMAETNVETGFLWAAALMVCSSLVVYLIMRRIGIFKSMR